MASTTEKREIAFKHTLDVEHTRTDKQWFEETFTTRHTTPLGETWADDVNYNDAAAAVAASVAIQETDFVLTLDPFSDGHRWIAKSNPGVWPYDGPLTDYTQLEIERIKNWISPIKFGPSSSTGYAYILKQNDGSPIPDGNWEINFAMGVLHLDNGHTAIDKGWSTPLKLTAYRYIGDFGSIGAGAEVDLHTEEDLLFEVDYATGTAPTPGTVVTTQAEADAINPVKYCQNVLEVLPTFINHFIDVDVAGGNQYAKSGAAPGSAGMWDIFLYLRAIPVSGVSKMDLTRYPYLPSISFHGEINVLESGIAGTSSNKTFARSSGSWTPGELQDKFISITSGAGAGQKFLVKDNTADIITLAGWNYSTGSATISTYELATKFINKIDGTGYCYGGIAGVYGGGSVQPLYGFEDIQIGNLTDRFGFSGLINVGLIFTRCLLYGFASQSVGESGGNVNSADCMFHYTSADIRPLEFYGGGLQTQSTILRGARTFISLVRGAAWYPYDTTIIPDVGYSGYLVSQDINSHVNADNRSAIEGNNLCKAFNIIGDGGGMAFADAAGIKVDDCAVVARIRYVNIGFTSCFKGSNNALGFLISEGSAVKLKNPSTLGVTGDLAQIDGDSFNPVAAGDKFIGTSGSSMLVWGTV